MHRINRDAVPVPACLAPPPASYADLRGLEKESIRAALLTIQGQRCAYCERRTGDGTDDGHIEHFRNQANHRDLDCDWNNMFWSCNDEKTCGKHKDNCVRAGGVCRTFNSGDIINPALEDPESLLLFVEDGTVRPVDGLSDHDRNRAEETLRVFQLADSVFLCKSREDAVKPYKNAVKTLFKIDPNYVVDYVVDELGGLDTTPFATPIRKFLESVI
ncbi:MAG: TIGR02646 family protein [Candidatus Marsarchaeota archaeon]|nr:TIGR02646 family protein [Candidatus Marsarchaeota archaeon]